MIESRGEAHAAIATLLRGKVTVNGDQNLNYLIEDILDEIFGNADLAILVDLFPNGVNPDSYAIIRDQLEGFTREDYARLEIDANVKTAYYPLNELIDFLEQDDAVSYALVTRSGGQEFTAETDPMAGLNPSDD